MNEPRWLVEARYCVRQRDTEVISLGVMMIHERLNRLAYAGEWDEVTNVINHIDPETDSTHLLLSVSLATKHMPVRGIDWRHKPRSNHETRK